MHTQRYFAVALAGALTIGGVYALAGPLTPPTGPVAPTPGPEPRRSVNDLRGDATALHVIREGGSYRLTEDIIGEPDLHGILIWTEDDVTIDGMGFTMNGLGVAGDGVAFEERSKNRTVRLQNMRIRGWRSGVRQNIPPVGVRMNKADLVEILASEIADSHGTDQGGGGVFNSGGTLTINGSTISGGAGDGVVAGDDATIEGSDVSGNRGAGLKAGRGLVLKGSKILQNFLPAVQTGADAIIEENHIGGGIITGAYVRFASNVVSLDLDDGSSGPVVFNDGLHQIKGNEFNMHVLVGLLLPAVQAVGDDVSVTGNRFLIVAPDMLQQPPVGVRMPPHFTTMDGLRHHFQGNSFDGIPAGTEALLARGHSHVIKGNSFIAREEGAQGIIGDATRSAIFGNTFMNMKTADAVTLDPQANFIGPILGPAGAAQNCSPERNLVISIPPTP